MTNRRVQTENGREVMIIAPPLGTGSLCYPEWATPFAQLAASAPWTVTRRVLTVGAFGN